MLSYIIALAIGLVGGGLIGWKYASVISIDYKELIASIEKDVAEIRARLEAKK